MFIAGLPGRIRGHPTQGRRNLADPGFGVHRAPVAPPLETVADVCQFLGVEPVSLHVRGATGPIDAGATYEVTGRGVTVKVAGALAAALVSAGAHVTASPGPGLKPAIIERLRNRKGRRR